jgi:hypothetical protein
MYQVYFCSSSFDIFLIIRKFIFRSSFFLFVSLVVLFNSILDPRKSGESGYPLVGSEEEGALTHRNDRTGGVPEFAGFTGVENTTK